MATLALDLLGTVPGPTPRPWHATMHGGGSPEAPSPGIAGDDGGPLWLWTWPDVARRGSTWLRREKQKVGNWRQPRYPQPPTINGLGVCCSDRQTLLRSLKATFWMPRKPAVWSLPPICSGSWTGGNTRFCVREYANANCLMSSYGYSIEVFDKRA